MINDRKDDPYFHYLLYKFKMVIYKREFQTKRTGGQWSTGPLNFIIWISAGTNKSPAHMGGAFIGGLEEIRTPDPRNANAMRSQLRYEPLFLGVALKIIPQAGSFVKKPFGVPWIFPGPDRIFRTDMLSSSGRDDL